jgi:hypothetical protein
MPTTYDGVTALLLHVHDLQIKHGELVFPLGPKGQSFACRVLAYCASALIRLRLR